MLVGAANVTTSVDGQQSKASHLVDMEPSIAIGGASLEGLLPSLVALAPVRSIAAPTASLKLSSDSCIVLPLLTAVTWKRQAAHCETGQSGGGAGGGDCGGCDGGDGGGGGDGGDGGCSGGDGSEGGGAGLPYSWA